MRYDCEVRYVGTVIFSIEADSEEEAMIAAKKSFEDVSCFELRDNIVDYYVDDCAAYQDDTNENRDENKQKIL